MKRNYFFCHWPEIFDLLSVWKISFIMMDVDFLTEICIFRLWQRALGSLNNVLFVLRNQDYVSFSKFIIFGKKLLFYHRLEIFDLLSVYKIYKISSITMDIDFFIVICISRPVGQPQWCTFCFTKIRIMFHFQNYKFEKEMILLSLAMNFWCAASFQNQFHYDGCRVL